MLVLCKRLFYLLNEHVLQNMYLLSFILNNIFQGELNFEQLQYIFR